MIDISGYLNNFSSTFVWLYSFLQSLHDSIVTTAQAKKKKKGKSTDQSFQNTPCLKLKHQNADHDDLKCNDKGHIFYFFVFCFIFLHAFLVFHVQIIFKFLFTVYFEYIDWMFFFYFYNQNH